MSQKKKNILMTNSPSEKWFDSLDLEEQFYATIECNHLIFGDCTRHPSTLSETEIELIYKHLHRDKIK